VLYWTKTWTTAQGACIRATGAPNSTVSIPYPAQAPWVTPRKLQEAVRVVAVVSLLRRRRRAAIFAARILVLITQSGRERPHPAWRQAVQALTRRVAHVPIDRPFRACNLSRVIRRRSASRGQFLRCARRRQCLGAPRRPRTGICAASGIDRACAQRAIGSCVMPLERLTLTRDFCEAYSAVISVGVALTPLPHRPMWSA
jgi:hypothetical protein